MTEQMDCARAREGHGERLATGWRARLLCNNLDSSARSSHISKHADTSHEVSSHSF